MSNPAKSFIEPMSAFFDQPPGSNAGEFFAALADELSQFGDDFLAAGAKSIRLTRKYRSFPTIAECVEAVRTARLDVANTNERGPVTPQYGAKSDDDEWERKVAAWRLCRSDMGHEARKDGWLVALFDFCRERGRLPVGIEATHCVSLSAQSRQGLDQCRGTPLYASLANLRAKMIARVEKEVFGREDAQ